VKPLPQHLEITKKGSPAQGKARHHLLRRLAAGIAAREQVAVGRTEFPEAKVEKMKSLVEARFVALAFVREQVDDVFTEEQRSPPRLFPMLLHFEVGKTIGPGKKGPRHVVLIEFAKKRQTRLLQDVFRIGLGGDETEDVTKKAPLMPGQEHNEVLGGARGGVVVHAVAQFSKVIPEDERKVPIFFAIRGAGKTRRHLRQPRRKTRPGELSTGERGHFTP